MKEFNLIHNLSEDEFDDWLYFFTDIEINRTGLKYKLSSVANSFFNKNIPHILVFKDSELNYLNYKTYSDYSIIKLSPNPYVLVNNLDLPEKDLNDIFEFIKTNKKILMKYWNWKCSSFELRNNIRRINEII